MESVTLVTTCKGRLSHAVQALPTWRDFRIVFVDYDCPEYSGRWALSALRHISVLSVDRCKLFNLSKARNLAMPLVQTEWVAFIDCDMRIRAGFKQHLESKLTENSQLVFDVMREGYAGFVCCKVSDWKQVCGFDEAAEGYGYEDSQFKEKLWALGRVYVNLDSSLLVHIEHANEDRTRYYKEHDLSMSYASNRVTLQRNLEQWKKELRHDG